MADVAAATLVPVPVAAPALSTGQVAFFAAYVWTLALFGYALYLHRRRQFSQKGHADADIDIEVNASSESAPLVGKGEGKGDAPPKAASPPMVLDLVTSPLVRVLMLDQGAIHDSKEVLRYMVEFGAIMVWFFLCDRTDLFGSGTKEYSRDLFLFLFVLLVIVAGATSMQPVRTPLLLNRPQTEEWKGWMQVLFLFYHYFEAREAYNAIRIFIAGYVWMTGFGNFSYYYRTGDFGVGRFCQMMWRLNFMVFFCCVVLRNDYMLYYICPMHTIFTVFVYAALALAPSANKHSIVVWGKIAGSFLLVYVLWDVKAVFYGLWGRVTWLVGYVDPRKGADQDELYEWYFRSGLDRYVWIYGMICAFMHPVAMRFLVAIDELPVARRWGSRGLLVALVAALFAVYYQSIYTLPKIEYNKVHPYTSWIPLTMWIVVRNLTPAMRTWSLRLFGWLGCITLETYLSQFHIWLKSEVPNGQPKFLLTLLPGYPMLNFALCTGLYVYISHRLFLLTDALKSKLVPHDDNHTLLRNIILMLALLGFTYGVGWTLEQAGVAGLL